MTRGARRKATGGDDPFPGVMPRENPKEIPVGTPERLEEIRRWADRKKPRSVLDDMDLSCPSCEVGIMRPSKDLHLEWEEDGTRTALRDLRGHRCERCGERIFGWDGRHLDF